MTPAVSVITIFLDAEQFLQEAIDSVFAQTFTDWELVLVDDGSTDRSGEIARGAVARDRARVRLVSHPGHVNRGMSASRNLGIAEASAPLVALLDADDVYLPEKLERQVAVLDSHPDVGMVHGPMYLWAGWTGDPADAARDRLYEPRVAVGSPIEPPDLFVRYLRGSSPTPATCSVLLRRGAVERAGGFEEAFVGMYEDQAFFYKVALRERVVAIAEPFDRYRQHPASTTSRALASGEWHRKEPNAASDRFLTWLDGYVAAGVPHEDVVRRELRRALRRERWARTRPGLAVGRFTRRARASLRRRMRRWR